MDAYSTLVDNVCKVEALQKAILEMADAHDTINLIRPDWEEHLNNYLPFQDLKQNASKQFKSELLLNNDVKFQSLRKTKTPFKILLAGNCLIHRPYADDTTDWSVKRSKKNESFSIKMVDSVVLEKIVDVMKSDLGAEVVNGDYHKFDMDSCDSLLCRTCMTCRQNFEEKGYKIARENQPCIRCTKWFDGERIVNRFACTLSESIRGYFHAIVVLTIESRYHYIKREKDGITQTQTIKLKGSVHDMIAFQEAKLTSHADTIYLGDLTNNVVDVAKSELAEVYDTDALETVASIPSTELCGASVIEGCEECLTIGTRLDTSGTSFQNTLKRPLEELSSDEEDEEVIEALPIGYTPKNEDEKKKKQKKSDDTEEYTLNESEMYL